MTTTLDFAHKREVKIGDYTLTGKIGQGGVAEVYRARQESLNRDVAVKILSAEMSADPDIVRRFERESLVIARLNHPNIVHVIDRGKAGGRYYFVMEYVDGTSLRQVIDSGAISLASKLEMILQVLKSLDYAHKNGVIHRDIKPGNILVDRHGNVQVADFGIAQIVGTPDHEMTATDVIMGTVAYMSPEQKVSSRNVDQTTDIYAIGVILYEIFTGKKPQGHFKPPSHCSIDTPAGFDPIVMKCLAQDARDRFQSAVELKDALLDVMGGSGKALNNGNGPATSFAVAGTESFLGKCRYLDTIKETQYGATILVENLLNKQLYVLKKHNKGEAGRKEAKLLSTLKHQNINAIYGAGGDMKSTVVISHYCQGGSLSDRMVRAHDWEKGMAIIVQIARGLDFAHKNNIVHGNIRPSNVLFDATETAKLTDFGLPVHYDSTGKRNWYSPPERKPGKSGDLYALGVIAHQLLTGRNPGYDSGNSLILENERGLPTQVKKVLGKLLAIRPSHRYLTAGDFLQEWEVISSELSSLPASTPSNEVLPPTGGFTLPAWAWALAAGLFILIVFLVLLLFSGSW